MTDEISTTPRALEDIAHDFNNLLAAIMNYASFIAEEAADNPAIRADAEQIQAAAEQAVRLTEQLSILARRAGGETILVVEDKAAMLSREDPR